MAEDQRNDAPGVTLESVYSPPRCKDDESEGKQKSATKETFVIVVLTALTGLTAWVIFRKKPEPVWKFTPGLDTSIQNQDASRSELLDEDIAREPTDYITPEINDGKLLKNNKVWKYTIPASDDKIEPKKQSNDDRSR